MKIAEHKKIDYINSTDAEELFKQINKRQLPRHIAIIMDGNGRWAKQHHFRSRIFGHREGIKSVREITTTCAELGIEALTLYAFSKENWKRPQNEINELMKLLEEYLIKELPELNRNNIHLIASGHLNDLPLKTLHVLNETISATHANNKMILNLALSYGGRDEIVDATRKISEDVLKGIIKPSSINVEMMKKYLYIPELPEPDLLIRTSGELRISNFLLWHIAYTEIYVTPVLWPDFRKVDLYKAIIDFQRRERRFGTVSTKLD